MNQDEEILDLGEDGDVLKDNCPFSIYMDIDNPESLITSEEVIDAITCMDSAL